MLPAPSTLGLNLAYLTQGFSFKDQSSRRDLGMLWVSGIKGIAVLSFCLWRGLLEDPQSGLYVFERFAQECRT